MHQVPLQTWVCFGVFLALLVLLLVWLFRDNDRSRATNSCSQCGYDLRGTPARCPECGTVNEARARYVALRRLRDEWPADRIVLRRPEPGEALVEVFRTHDGMLAPLVKRHLFERGIFCQLRATTPAARPGVTGFSGSHTIRVWSEDADRARAIMNWLLEELPAEREKIVAPHEE
jgi:hypothetical protein